MTNILVTHSFHLADDPKQLRKMQPYAPLGTLYAAAALRDAGFALQVFDTTLRDPRVYLEPVLRRNVPNIVVIYEDDFNFLSKMCLLTMRETACYIATLASKCGSTVIVHGSDATDFPLAYLEGGADYVLTGEAEATLPELCQRLLVGDDIRDVAGLLWSGPDGTLKRSSKERPTNQSWTQTSAPARELIDLEPYRRAWTGAHGRFSANIVASRGCPFSCNWCAKPISGNRFQLRPADAVAREIRDMKSLYGVQHLWFSDDIFGLNRQWLREFVAAVRKHHARLPYKVQARADLVHAETAELLADSGCSEVWMGVESGSQKVLDAMDKKLQLSDVRNATKRLRDHGIAACFFLQLGYPGEGWAEILETLDLVRSTRPDDIGVSISYPLPGTVFHERVRADLAAKQNWQHSDDLCVTFPGAYTREFYLGIRDALHDEVAMATSGRTRAAIDAMWRTLEAQEPLNRRGEIKALAPVERHRGFLPLSSLAGLGGVA